MRRYITGLCACSAFFAVNHATILRAQSLPSPATYVALVSHGFEVKSIIVMDADTHFDPSSQVVATLKKDAVTTHCWITWSTYATGKPDDPRTCN